MLPHELQNFLSQTNPTAEILQRQYLTRQFYQEVSDRQEFERYCQWYYETAERHQKELEKMRGDINFFAWFGRDR